MMRKAAGVDSYLGGCRICDKGRSCSAKAKPRMGRPGPAAPRSVRLAGVST